MVHKCTKKIKSGKRKDELCDRVVEIGRDMCKIHTRYDTSDCNIDTIETLEYKLKNLNTTRENKVMITKRFRYLELLPVTSPEYLKHTNWLRYALNFPYNSTVKVPVSINAPLKIISKYVTDVYMKLDNYIYGMKNVKEELITFICKKISNPSSSNHILSLKGENGVGKTRLAHGLAKALDLPIRTINLGCINDVSYFTGHGFTYADSEPGRIVKILNETACKNCIIYFDELDKINDSQKGQSINAFLTHLIDNSQNYKFQDSYLAGLDLDISQVLFVFSLNDESLLDKTVRDRLKIINVPVPSESDQVKIAQKFIIPEICRNLEYTFDVEIDTIKNIVSIVNKHNQGLRQVKRTLDEIISKFNVLRMLTLVDKEKMSFFENDERKIISKITQSLLTSYAVPNLSYYS